MMAPPISLPAMFLAQAGKLADRRLLRMRRPDGIQDLTWNDVRRQARQVAAALIAGGFAPGDRAAILSENRPEWLIADLAIQMAGGVPVPIYSTNPASLCGYVLRDSGARVLFLSNPAQAAKVAEVAATLPDLCQLVAFEVLPQATIGAIPVAAISTFEGRDPELAEVDRRTAAITADDLFTLIYTSGTTGEPKGVMLTQRAICRNLVESIEALPPFGDGDVYLSFLPLSHTYERLVHYFCLATGAEVHYARALETLLEDLAEARPTALLGCVPRVLDKVHANFQAQRSAATGLKRKIVEFAVRANAEAADAAERHQPLAGLPGLRWRLAKKLVFSKLHAKLGGRVRFIISGSAPLSKEVARFFHGAGLPVLEGYGLTEACTVLTVNRLDSFRLGSVGRRLSSVELKIAADGEIMTRGEHVMKGYWNKPEATKEILAADGWLATGDIGEIGADGNLTITDRKKALMKTAGGKYVVPAPIIQMLSLEPHVDQVCLVGDARPYCVALIVPNFATLGPWVQAKGLKAGNRAELLALPDVVALFEAAVARVNSHLPQWETIKRFRLLAEPFSQDNGLLTPTMKTRTKAIVTRYSAEIDALYRDQP